MAWNIGDLKLRSGADREPPATWEIGDLKLRSGADRDAAAPAPKRKLIVTG